MTAGVFFIIGLYAPLLLFVSHVMSIPEIYSYQDFNLLQQVISLVLMLMPYGVMWYTRNFFTHE
jgi:hypothetical protein